MNIYLVLGKLYIVLCFLLSKAQLNFLVNWFVICSWFWLQKNNCSCSAPGVRKSGRVGSLSGKFVFPLFPLQLISRDVGAQPCSTSRAADPLPVPPAPRCWLAGSSTWSMAVLGWLRPASAAC